jgi:hypothetical protein
MARVAGWSGVTDVEVNEKQIEEITVNPNPVSGAAEIRFHNPSHGYVSLKLYDMLGRKVMSLYEGITDSGEIKIEMNTSHLNGGMYYLKLESQGRIETEKLVVW